MTGAGILNIDELKADEIKVILGDWQTWRREKQTPPSADWYIWMLLTGRGFGKTRVGAEMVRQWCNESINAIVNICGRTAADARDVMIEGESGLLSVCQYDKNKPDYNKNARQVTFPLTKSIVKIYTAEEPDGSRGAQCHKFWLDEISSWQYAEEAFSNIILGARLGSNVQGVITSTPKPNKIIKQLVADSKTPEKRTFITRGSTYENRANLSQGALDYMRNKYEGTRLGRQELYGELLEDNPNALWNYENIDKYRLPKLPKEVELQYIKVGVDPAVTSGEDSCETGIITCGIDADKHSYVLSDDTMKSVTPGVWAAKVVEVYHRYNANSVIVEVNNGGETITELIKNIDPYVVVNEVRASRGKTTRAEPIAQLYEQGKVHHVGNFPELEQQICEWEPGMDSPDRMDALVWCMTGLNIQERAGLWHV